MDGPPFIREDAPQWFSGLFDMTNGFVDMVFSNSFIQFLDDNNINSRSDLEELTIKDYIPLLIGVLMCVLVGAVTALVLPICGCCQCCCLVCCSCCKGKRQKPSSCKRVTFSIIMFALTFGMLFMIGCSFTTNAMVEEELKGNTLEDIGNSFNSIEKFLNDTGEDVEEAVLVNFNYTMKEMLNILKNFGEHTVSQFIEATGMDPALYYLDDYAQSLEPLSGNLSAMVTSTSELQSKELFFINTQIPLQHAIIYDLNNCQGVDICDELLFNIEDINLNTNFLSLDTQNVSIAQLAAQAAVDGGVPQAVEAIIDQFETIENDINNQLTDNIEDIEKEILEFEKNLQHEVEDFQDSLANVEFDGVDDFIVQVQPQMNTLGSILHIYFIIISSLCLIPGILYACAVPIGNIGGPRGAGHGARCLKAGKILTLFFGIFFMLTTTILFAVGASLQGLACGHIVVYDDTMQQIEARFRTDNYSLTGKELINSCKNDDSFYEALNIAENVVNISKILDLDNTQLPDMIEKLNNITLETGNITVITPDIADAITSLENTTNNIDFNPFLIESSKSITVGDYPEYIEGLRNAALVVPNDNFSTYADQLEELYNTTILEMEYQSAILQEATDNSYTISSAHDMTKVVEDLLEAQSKVIDNTDEILKAIISNSTDQLYVLLDQQTQEIVNDIENEVANCRPLYDAVTGLIYAPCVYLLYPLNAMWFCYGSYAAFAILAMIFASKLAEVFKAVQEHPKVNPEVSPDAVSLNQVAPMPVDTTKEKAMTTNKTLSEPPQVVVVETPPKHKVKTEPVKEVVQTTVVVDELHKKEPPQVVVVETPKKHKDTTEPVKEVVQTAVVVEELHKKEPPQVVVVETPQKHKDTTEPVKEVVQTAVVVNELHKKEEPKKIEVKEAEESRQSDEKDTKEEKSESVLDEPIQPQEEVADESQKDDEPVATGPDVQDDENVDSEGVVNQYDKEKEDDKEIQDEEKVKENEDFAMNEFNQVKW